MPASPFECLRRPVLLYAGPCRFCAWSAHVVAKLDRRGRLAILSMAEPEAETMLEAVPMLHRYRTWHLVYPDGRFVRPPEAVIDLLDLLDPLAPVAWFVRRFRLQGVVVRLEKLVSTYRGKLGKVVPRTGSIRRFP